MKKYNPLFLEQYNSADYHIPNMIMIVDDAVRRGIDVCEGAIGWTNKEKDIEVLYLYDEAVETSGIQFIPTEGFVVLAGSSVNENTSEKSLTSGAVRLREKLFKEGKVDNLKTTEDILFSSSSAAADFILGYSASGPRTWKNEKGISLKDLESK